MEHVKPQKSRQAKSKGNPSIYLYTYIYVFVCHALIRKQYSPLHISKCIFTGARIKAIHIQKSEQISPGSINIRHTSNDTHTVHSNNYIIAIRRDCHYSFASRVHRNGSLDSTRDTNGNSCHTVRNSWNRKSRRRD